MPLLGLLFQLLVPLLFARLGWKKVEVLCDGGAKATPAPRFQWAFVGAKPFTDFVQP